jgi:hypothetical protein
MKRTILITALAVGLASCSKEEPKSVPPPAAPAMVAPAIIPAPADATKDAAKSSTDEAPKGEAPKSAEAGKDATK